MISAFAGLTIIQSRSLEGLSLNPYVQIALYIAIVIFVALVHAASFGEIYYRLYRADSRSFTASESYIERRRADAVKELWLSKDMKSNAYFTNWILLDMSKYLNDPNSLNVFTKAYKKHYGDVLTYRILRDKLSKKYADLSVKVGLRQPRVQVSEGQTRIVPSDFPDVVELVQKLSSGLAQYNVDLAQGAQDSEPINRIRASILSCYQEFQEYVSIARLDVVLNIKANEILSNLKINDGKNAEVKDEIEKILFYHLSRRMLVKTDGLSIKLYRPDFYYYGALSFFSASQGDIRPATVESKAYSVIQVIATFVILALSIALLNMAVGQIRHSLWDQCIQCVCGYFKAIMLVSLLIIMFGYGLSWLWNYCSHVTNREILKIPENYGYTINRVGTIDLIINLNSQNMGGHYLNSENGLLTATMPYRPSPAIDLRYPGVLITKNTTKIVWGEVLLPFMEQLYVYGDGFNINEIKEPYKILVPATIQPFQ